MNDNSSSGKRVSSSALAGLHAALPWVTVPAWAAWLSSLVFGASEDVLTLAAAMWAAMVVGGLWLRGTSPVGSEARWRGVWIAVPSLLLGAVLVLARLVE